MKKVYWRPKAVSRTALLLIAGFSLLGLIMVESWQVTRERPFQAEKLAAARLAADAMETLYFAREEVGPAIDRSIDPTESGLIGLTMSPVTSISGHLIAKQTTVNPNFAAAMVDMLKRADVGEGDVVAVGVSGSFPALNVCTYAALEVLKAKSIVIASAAASQFGANVPDLLWIDMERVLQDQGVMNIRSVAASVGGYEDRGLGMSEEGLALIDKAIARNGLLQLEAEEFEACIEERMNIYKDWAKGKPIKAYINVGGGTVSVGRSLGKKMFSPGLNRRTPDKLRLVDGVMPRFIADGVPVIHMVQVAELAERYGMPISPQTMPQVGEATVFSGFDYNRWLAATILFIEVALLYTFIRSDIGFRLLRMSPQRKEQPAPEPMV